METLIYLGKVNLYWILLLGCYWLLLRRHTFFQLNRFYLLGSLLVAFALPFVIYPETAPALPVQYEFSAETITISAEEVAQPLFSWQQVFWTIYVMGLAIFGNRLVLQIIRLRNFINSGEKIELEDCTVILIDSNHVGSFSFMKWIVINRSDYEYHFDAILRHEMVHTRQRHSLDILLIELFHVVFWFNPVFLFYKSALQEIHEFLADKEAPNREHYAQFLVAYALNAPIAALTNHFFKPSQIKNRIRMIYKNRTSNWLLSTYFVAAVLIAGTAVLVAGCENSNEQSPSEESLTLTDKDKGGKPVFTVVEKQPEFPGGDTEMFKFLGKNIRYPKAATSANVSGRVFISFIVTHEGKIGDITVLKGIGFGCDEEAARVVALFPKWKPGYQNGEPVNVKFNLPINFQIEETGSVEASPNREVSFAEVAYVVDGKVAESKPNLDVAKIASVNVLKGEQATSKYGAIAKRGAVEIKTKNEEPASYKATDIPAIHRPDVRISEVYEAKSITGTPNAPMPKPATVTIRGNNLLGSDPLVIIDGEKQEERGQAAFGHIKPDDIKSVTVLKDLNAVRIYGEEGVNGVVLITTKGK